MPAVVPPIERPLVMGVVNVTPDSFSDGGRFLDPELAVAHGRRLVAEGADIVDVGGESTRPGADPVAEDVELRRVLPVIEALAGSVRVSIDTTKPAVARAAVQAGATLINDISASLHAVAAETGAGWVAMHMRGTPRSMQDAARYDDVVGEVRAYLEERVAIGRSAGIDEIWVDPGIGFAKTATHNLQLLRHLEQFTDLGAPLLVGTSRKGFLGAILGESDAGRTSTAGSPRSGAGSEPGATVADSDDRLEGSVATATWAMLQGAAMIRAHDVLATVQAARVVAA